MNARGLMAVVCGLVSGLTALAVDEDAYSPNIHAIIRVETASSNVLIAVPWTFYTPTGVSTTNLPVNRLVWPANLDEDDLLMMVTKESQQTENKYVTWTLVKDPSDGAGSWVSTQTISKGGDNQSDVRYPVARGIGLWLIRQNPKDSAGNWKPFFLYGQYAAGEASVSVSNESAAANAVMIANPLCRAVAVNTDISWSGVGADDTLSIPNGTDAWDMALWDATLGKWYVSKAVRQGRKVVTSKDYNLTIPAGHGFWYVRRTVGEITITFTSK